MKAMIQAQETASILDPSIDIGRAAMEEARDALISGLTLDNIRKTATETGLRVGKELVRRLPTLEAAAFMWIDQFGRGKITVASTPATWTPSSGSWTTRVGGSRWGCSPSAS
ncbi:MAG TPA: hypothetical protein VIK13_07900 [Candidatus Limnocylindrales bacterium]